MFYQFYLEIRIENYVFNEIDENIMKFVSFFISYILRVIKKANN